MNVSRKHPLEIKTNCNSSFIFDVRWGPACWSERNSRGVLPLVHLSKQWLKPEITHQQHRHDRRARAEEQSNSRLRTGNKQSPLQTQWGDSGSCCGDCTPEQEEETSYQTQARKQSNGRGGCSFLFRRGGAEVRGGETAGGTNRGGEGGLVWASRGSKTCLAWPLPSSSSSESQ